ncbi:MAG: hypothetical protein AAB434_12375 [Planctomycetota bacterium]
MTRAIALLSGGLDSTLAVKLVADQGIHVTALTFMTHFGCSAGIEGSSCGHDVSWLKGQPFVEIRLCHLGKEYIDMVRRPKFGYGRNMNPCIDCRIFMLRWAKEYLEINGGDFLITGEVVGQRPMSQRLETFPRIDREAGLEGLVLRPLSAQVLPPTKPEMEGKIDRSRLRGIWGRSRREQLKMAAEYGLIDIPTPAGGCLLTDPGFSRKLKDLFLYTEDPQANDIQLLKAGRHFRLSPYLKVVIGRNEGENAVIESLLLPGDRRLEAVDYFGPVTVVRGKAGAAEIEWAARLTLRYGKCPRGTNALVRVVAVGSGAEQVVDVVASEPEGFESVRVGATAAARTAAE